MVMAKTCSMIACPRWTSTAGRLLVVKNAWNRNTSNKDACPGSAGALRSGLRRTTRRPGTRSAYGAGANAVKPISATSATEIHAPVASSRTACG